MKRNNKKGFTIVELVIVIAVIAILSAVLIPTFSGVTKSAQEKADQANARNLYTQYISTEEHVGETVDYVKIENVYYDVDDGFKVVTVADGFKGHVLEKGANGPAVTCTVDNCKVEGHAPAQGNGG